MVSKGVQYYTFMSGSQFQVKFGAPGYNNLQNSQADNYVQKGLQIDSANMSGFTGDFTWQALMNGGQIDAGNEWISSLTGNIEGGTMGNMMSTPSTVAPHYAVSYGFYDSGSAEGTPLTNQDQFYCYASDNYSNWMGDLTTAYSAAKRCSFNQFALPGAHDSGMCTMSTSLDILASPYGAALISSLMIIPGVGEAVSAIAASQAPFAIQNIAITQKDTITTMLNLGIRYFDFRPGTLYPAIAGYNPGVRYHEHAVIPGYPYIQFLEDVLSWLSLHTGEIVVVSANTQGMKGPLPAPSDLTSDLNAAVKNVNLSPPIATGNSTNLTQTYEELITSNTRLIFLNQNVDDITIDPDYAPKNDSYFASGANYSTTGYSGIIDAFKTTPASGNGVYTVLQMQGTATSASWTVIATAIATTSYAYSPLMSTKPNNDTQTNQWLLSNVASNFATDQLIVFLNDFADNCMTSTAITCTKQRMGLIQA